MSIKGEILPIVVLSRSIAETPSLSIALGPTPFDGQGIPLLFFLNVMLCLLDELIRFEI